MGDSPPQKSAVTSFTDDFGPFGRTTWLNCAHQGPLPRIAAREAKEAVRWKRLPSELTTERFEAVPRRLGRALGRLIGVSSDDVILANSASYGLHLLANGIPWRGGDWLAMQTPDDLATADADVELADDTGARKYDVFGTANFFNFKPWAAAVEYLLRPGIDAIRSHDQMLVDRLLRSLDPDRYQVISPREGPRRSALVIFSHRDPQRNAAVYDALMEEQVYAALRRGNIRISAHLYNTTDDIDRALGILHRP